MHDDLSRPEALLAWSPWKARASVRCILHRMRPRIGLKLPTVDLRMPDMAQLTAESRSLLET